MEMLGRVDHGVIVPQSDAPLPEGALVRIVYEPDPDESNRPGHGGTIVEFPLVRSRFPGSVHLTNQRIQEILDEEDFSPGH